MGRVVWAKEGCVTQYDLPVLTPALGDALNSFDWDFVGHFTMFQWIESVVSAPIELN